MRIPDRWPRMLPGSSARPLRVGVVVAESGEGLTVEVAGRRVGRTHLWTLGRFGGGAWPGLEAAVRSVVEANPDRRVRVTLALERPLAQTKLLALPRLRRDDAVQLLERNADTFFQRPGAGPAAAGFARRGRGSTAVTIAPAELVAAAERAVTAAGATLVAVVAAGPAAVAGARVSLQGLAGGWHLLRCTAGALELAQVRRGRVIALRSRPLAGEVKAAAAAIDLLGDVPAGERRVVVAASGAPTAEMISALAEAGWEPVIPGEPLDGRLLAALGAVAGGARLPRVLSAGAAAALRRERMLATGGSVAAACAAVLLLAGGYAGLLHHRLAAVQRERAALHGDVAAVLRVRSRIDALEARAGVVEGAAAKRSSAVRLLGQVTDALPDDAYLTALRLEKGELRLDGWAHSATALVPVFERERWARAVRLGAGSERARSAEGVQERFTLVLTLAPGGGR